VQIGNSASGTLALLTLACGEYAMKQSSVAEWHRRFKEGREDVQEDPRSGQPKIATLVLSDRGMGEGLTAEELNMGVCPERKTRTVA
jgi:hypothetical protein